MNQLINILVNKVLNKEESVDDVVFNLSSIFEISRQLQEDFVRRSRINENFNTQILIQSHKKVDVIIRSQRRAHQQFYEIYNFEYVMNLNKAEKNQQYSVIQCLNMIDYVKPQLQADETERVQILNQCTDYYDKYMKNDMYTRQFVIQKKYLDNTGKEMELAACPSLFQFINRIELIKYDDKLPLFERTHLDLHIFLRSQHLNNFLYDNYSFILYYFVVFNLLLESHNKIHQCCNLGNIHVHVTSLHKEKGEK